MGQRRTGKQQEDRTDGQKWCEHGPQLAEAVGAWSGDLVDTSIIGTASGG